jgi:hypothetical protein
MALSYLGPNVIYALVLVSAHGGSVTEIAVVASSAFAVTVIVAVLAGVVGPGFFTLFRSSNSAEEAERGGRGATADDRSEGPAPAPQPKKTDGASERYEPEFENVNDQSMMMESFGPAFDGARSAAGWVRIYFLEELLVSAVLQGISGIRPEHDICGPVAISMASVAFLHLLYLLVIRPYSARIELAFAVVGATLVVVLASLATALTYSPADSSSESVLLKAVGVIVLISTALFFLQLVVMLVAALATNHKKRLQRQLEQSEEMDLPLLAVPTAGSAPALTQTPSLHPSRASPALNPLKATKNDSAPAVTASSLQVKNPLPESHRTRTSDPPTRLNPLSF